LEPRRVLRWAQQVLVRWGAAQQVGFLARRVSRQARLGEKSVCVRVRLAGGVAELAWLARQVSSPSARLAWARA
jgi:hypothetical protein